MPKPHTFPTLIDECKTVSIKKLKEWDYLGKGKINMGTITWSRHGQVHSSISAYSNTTDPRNMYLELSYTWNDEPVKYRIKLIEVKSNLDKGSFWLFVCPQSGRRCRILHMVQKYFWHHSAFTGCMYESQTYSKSFRYQLPFLKASVSIDKVDNLSNRKQLKKTYKGRITKTYANYLRKMELAEIAFKMQLF